MRDIGASIAYLLFFFSSFGFSISEWLGYGFCFLLCSAFYHCIDTHLVLWHVDCFTKVLLSMLRLEIIFRRSTAQRRSVSPGYSSINKRKTSHPVATTPSNVHLPAWLYTTGAFISLFPWLFSGLVYVCAFIALLSSISSSVPPVALSFIVWCYFLIAFIWYRSWRMMKRAGGSFIRGLEFWFAGLVRAGWGN